MGRRVWSDPEVIELAQRFVVAADEVYRLQSDDSAECRLFRRMVRGDERATRGTMQGIYLFSPGGELLARRNSNDPEAILEIIEKGWAKWQELPADRRRLPDADAVQPSIRWEDSYPDGGLILRRTARDLPRDGDPETKPARRFNRDAVWFTKEEARSWVPARLASGEHRRVPARIAERLACFVLVDNARGQTLPYHPSEVAHAALETTITRVDGDRAELRITGVTRAVAEGPWLWGENYWKPEKSQQWPHSLSTKILGAATFDGRSGAFVDFQLLALGERHGRTINNSRGLDAAGPIGFVLELAAPGWRVAPTFINVYNADWVEPPN